MVISTGLDPVAALRAAGEALSRAVPALPLLAPPLLLRARAVRARGRVAVMGAAPDADPVLRLLGAGPGGAGRGRGPFAPDAAGCAALVAAAAGADAPVDRVVLVLPGAGPDVAAGLARRLRVLDAEISLLAGPGAPGCDSRLDGLPVRVLARRALPVWGRAVKRAADLALAALLLALFAPMLIYVGLAVWLEDGGAPLFRQAREGRNGARFEVLKFRTMRVAPGRAEAAPFQQTRRGDARLTRLGPFLRRTSIDELPQLINVLRGEMSLIGPRPHVPGLLAAERREAALEPDYARRHRVRPGLSGWAQVNHSRGALDGAASLARRLQLDLWYVEHWSLALDLKVACLTPARLLFHRGAAY